jgi:hypothetical protein
MNDRTFSYDGAPTQASASKLVGIRIFRKDPGGAVFHTSSMISTRPAREPARGRGVARAGIRGLAPTLGGVLGFVLLPKCPLCVAALLGVAGFGGGAASLAAPFLRPSALLLAMAALVRAAWLMARRARAARAGGPDAGGECASGCGACGPSAG